MTKKKLKIKIGGLDISGSYEDLKKIEQAFTLAAIEQRSEGHLVMHEKFLNLSLLINNAISEQVEKELDK